MPRPEEPTAEQIKMLRKAIKEAGPLKMLVATAQQAYDMGFEEGVEHQRKLQQNHLSTQEDSESETGTGPSDRSHGLGG